MPDEGMALPAERATVKDLLAFLQGARRRLRGGAALPEVIRVAIDQEHVEHDAPIAGAREIALFPPMTGG